MNRQPACSNWQPAQEPEKMTTVCFNCGWEKEHHNPPVSIEKLSTGVEFLIGKMLSCYSTSLRYHNENRTASVYLGKSGNNEERVVKLRIPLIRWEVQVTDQDFIIKLLETDYSTWEGSIMTELKKLLTPEQLIDAVSHTCNRVYDKGVKDGMDLQQVEIRKALGL